MMQDLTPKSEAITAAGKLARLRAAMAEHGIDAVFVPSSDPHLSEYLPPRWQGRAWLSGFTGSVGTVAVTQTEAALFADSRYWLQAETELVGSGIALVRSTSAGGAAQTDPIAWLAERLTWAQTLAVDGQVLSLGLAERLRRALEPQGARLAFGVDLLDAVWSGRPALPTAPVSEHLPPHATQTRSLKLAQLRAEMAREGATHHLVSSLDDIAWLLNLRGADVAFNPVFVAHMLVDAKEATLFVADGKIDAALAARLAVDGVWIAGYELTAQALRALPEASTLLLDAGRVTWGLVAQAPTGVKQVRAINPSTLMKSRKSVAEATHLRETMAQDGAALCEFYAWFEAALNAGERVTEMNIHLELLRARVRRPGFVGASFNTIAGFRAHGAMPHYSATEATDALIKGDGLLLIDSGGQYLGGTTDITRVWAIGAVTAEQKRDYTLVLKGLIGLSRARFPRGTLAPMLDSLARAPLWAEGCDYDHGTGHGVGYFLNVHEGPQNFSKAIPTPEMAMQPGMVTSIEPGLYRPGRWGVRLENLVLNVAWRGDESAYGEFLEFETLTLCPLDMRCIEPAMLEPAEWLWVDRYHRKVRERLAPLVDGAALRWLNERTKPLETMLKP